MSQTQNYPKYSISVSTSGVTVEAPTRKECVALFKQVQQTRLKPSEGLKDAIR
jgi:hypothetical protein